jgi:hypothetical protein
MELQDDLNKKEKLEYDHVIENMNKQINEKNNIIEKQKHD